MLSPIAAFARPRRATGAGRLSAGILSIVVHLVLALSRG
jgi:hypothetical protein